jgi:prephenate dehydrogenase
MAIHQISIIGTGLIGTSLALALKRHGFQGRIVGCDHTPILERAHDCGAIDRGSNHAPDAVFGSDVVILATPVLSIMDFITRLGPAIGPKTLLTDVGSTKAEVMTRAKAVFGKNTGARFLGGHPMAGKEQSGIEYADAELFTGAAWFVTTTSEQHLNRGLHADYLEWVQRIGARLATIDADEHDRLCAWISHLPQMISTALASALVDEYGEEAPLLDAGGRALREMTRISSSPYSMWRDIAVTNKRNIADALAKLEQRLAHIRENLDSKQLAEEFDRAHHLRKLPPVKTVKKKHR